MVTPYADQGQPSQQTGEYELFHVHVRNQRRPAGRRHDVRWLGQRHDHRRRGRRHDRGLPPKDTIILRLGHRDPDFQGSLPGRDRRAQPDGQRGTERHPDRLVHRPVRLRHPHLRLARRRPQTVRRSPTAPAPLSRSPLAMPAPTRSRTPFQTRTAARRRPWW